MIKINLLPDLVLQRRREAQIRQAATLALVVWLIVLAVITLLVLGYKLYEDGALKSAKNQNSDLSGQLAQTADFRTKALADQAALDALDTLSGTQSKLTMMGDTLTKVTPNEVSLNNLVFSPDGKLDIQGSATSYLAVAQFLTALRKNSVSSYQQQVTDIQKQQDAAKNDPQAAAQAAKLKPTIGYFSGVSLVGASQGQGGKFSFEITAFYTGAGFNGGGASQ